jgi:hypothetical protein
MNEEESLRYISTGEIPARMQGYTSEDHAQNEMEWDSQASKHRAFQPSRTPRQSQLFSQAPAAPEPSAFWYKGLPPAPVSQAHKLRNPPNAPRLQLVSKEAKENFSNTLTGRQSFSSPPESLPQATTSDDPFVTPRHHEIEFAQPKFFPPTSTTGDIVTGLSDMFEQAFTLKPSEKEIQDATSTSRKNLWKNLWEQKRGHVLPALVLLMALFSWNYSFAYSKLYVLKAPLVVMVVCGVIALRSLTDCFLAWSRKSPSLQSSGSALLAAAESVAVSYIIWEIMTGRAHYVTYQLQGSILVAVMFIQELYYVAIV